MSSDNREYRFIFEQHLIKEVGEHLDGDLRLKPSHYIVISWLLKKIREKKLSPHFVDGEEYYWLKSTFICDNLPALCIKPDAVGKIISKLVDQGWLRRKADNRENSIALFAKGPLLTALLKKSEALRKNSEGYVNKSEGSYENNQKPPSENFTNKPNNKKNLKRNKPEEGRHPSLPEVINYFLSNGFQRAVAIKFFEMSDSANWRDTKGNVIKNWKMKAQKVWFTDDHKITAPEKQRISKVDPTVLPKSKYPKLSD